MIVQFFVRQQQKIILMAKWHTKFLTLPTECPSWHAQHSSNVYPWNPKACSTWICSYVISYLGLPALLDLEIVKRAGSSSVLVISASISWSRSLYSVVSDSSCLPITCNKRSILQVSWVSWPGTDSLTRPYIMRKVRWYSSRYLPRNSACPPSEFFWQWSPHCCNRASNPWKNSSAFGTKNRLAAIIRV